jgi:hypothetical protein
VAPQSNGPADFPIAAMNDAELTQCPHCNGKTRLIPDERFRWVCGACGCARVPSPDEKAHSAAEFQHLQRSAQLVTQARLARVGGTFTGLGATFVALLAMLCLFVLHANPILSLLFIVASVVLSIVTAGFGRSARKKIDDAKTEVTYAWQEVAQALLNVHGHGLTAAELATMMRTTEPDAERLLTLLSVDDKVRSVVTGEAQIRYSLPAQMRVENPIASAPTTMAPSIRHEMGTAQTTLAPSLSEDELELARKIDATVEGRK